MLGFLQAMFGCWHGNTSFPRTTRPGHRGPKAADLTGTYVVCLDCGREFPYDWSTMKIVSEPKKEPVETTTVYER